MRTTLVVMMLVLAQYSTHTISRDSHHTPLDSDDIIRAMRTFDEAMLNKGYSLTLAVDRPGFWSGIRSNYRMRVSQDKNRRVIIEDKRRYYGKIAGGLSETSTVKPGEHIGFLSVVQYLEKLPNTYIEIPRGAIMVRFHSDGSFTAEAEGKPDKGGFIRLLRSPKEAVSGTWSERCFRALGRGITNQLGKGVSATMLEDGRIHLIAKDREWADGEWRLIVDPNSQYLVVQAELIDVTSGEIVEMWHNSGRMGTFIPLARNAVWMDNDNLIVECLDYQSCFAEEWYSEVESFVHNPPSGTVIRDLGVKPFVDFQVR